MKKGEFKIARLMRRLSPSATERRSLLQPLLHRQARLLISSGGKVKGLVQAMPPFKLDESGDSSVTARKRGLAAVDRGIRQVYGTPGELYALIRHRSNKNVADNFWAYYKAGRQADASRIAEEITGFRLAPFDGGRAHKDRRKPNGRVAGKYKSLFIADMHSMESYINLTQLRVGLMASALVQPGEEKLGAITAVPAFVRRNEGPYGNLRITQGADGERVEVSFHGPHAGIAVQRIFDSVLAFRMRAFQRELPHALTAMIKKMKLSAP